MTRQCAECGYQSRYPTEVEDFDGETIWLCQSCLETHFNDLDRCENCDQLAFVLTETENQGEALCSGCLKTQQTYWEALGTYPGYSEACGYWE